MVNDNTSLIKVNDYRLTDWLPTTRKEMDLRGWDYLDVIILSADAYVDHPSFGAAVIGRVLEDKGWRVGIVPQPDWHGDFRDFRRLGRPRMFFAVAPGAMDSMVNKYTANRRLRSSDAYSPDGRHDMRPEYPTIVYSQILKRLYPDVPVVVGGIEASLRRLTHYDYWQQRVRPSILCDCPADLLVYGMGELPETELCWLIDDKLLHGIPERSATASELRSLLRRYPLRQTVTLEDPSSVPGGISPDDIVLFSHEEVLTDKKKYALNFRHVEEESNKLNARRLIQPVGKSMVVVNPPFPPMTTDQIDHSFDLPYTRMPHPKYRGKTIPAYEMIRHSVCIHRGCFGGCAFCTISAHQGKFIMSRSEESILREVKAVTKMPDFKGVISDLGGPSANMYMMHGRRPELCARCSRPSCAHPKVCPNLITDHAPLLRLYRAVKAVPGVKRCFVGSGVRYDLILHRTPDEKVNRHNLEYAEELIVHHVSGRLKVAPEHTSSAVLQLMRKPPFSQFHQFQEVFNGICRKAHLDFQLIPYFISSHPGCSTEDMAELAAETKDSGFRLEQVQDFTPTPMTVSTTMWHSGYDPYTLKPVFTAKSPEEKLRQRMFFFWYKPEERQHIVTELRRMGREDLIGRLYPAKHKAALPQLSSERFGKGQNPQKHKKRNRK